MIAIIDYGMGNLLSVNKALAKLGYSSEVTSDPRTACSARGIIIPGVGAFADAIRNLNKSGLSHAVIEAAAKGVPLLGICLGFQLLFTTSFENGEHRGLDIIRGEVLRLPNRVKVPQMGWNQVKISRESPLLVGVPDNAFFYFVHSYYVSSQDEDAAVGETTYGCRFTSVVSRENVYGVQFHPEKSSTTGQIILKNFGELVNRC